jgi:hypothetical protein
MNRKIMLAFALAGALAMTTATVLADLEDFNPATGTGFLGKGDVQSAFGWDNAEAQANIPNISAFFTELTQHVEQACYTEGANQVFVTNRVGTRTSAPIGLNWEPRIHQQIDGIYFLGYTSDPDEALEDSEIDWVGPNNGCPPHTHPKFAPTFGEITVGPIFATFEGDTEQVWPSTED